MAPRKKTADTTELMVVNDVPGEECRIAITADGHLEELYAERIATATNVGNIYKGKVVNVEPAIQAAFIDFGEGTNGFLHISDLHPKYFPGEERTERVGKKIPRRERPPIQQALRRGDEILVQVLKEGLGTKGPTLTSYLSIPGRLLVMMPDMDRVGVSRKEDDPEKRREVRELLDSLDLPEGFGFIVRTAGVGRPKVELKRDAAYLTRLWKVMDKRIQKVGAPCELYRESDVLIRTVRDVMRPSIAAIIVDSESAFARVDTFLRVISPRSAPKVIWYKRRTPIFHAFDIERQIELIHSREVPLPSGGRLVIDQTEALVAIDVNSGRSRSAHDSETNAFQTNLEAADEICRQLRLRDLGGLIVNDLIDMIARRHRDQVLERFNQHLRTDRAKTTVLPISELGMLEMTRQRMRPSIRKVHYMPCPHCAGHGEIKAPEYVAADAVRRAAFLLEFPRVERVEMACSSRVASVLLSTKRRELVRMEDASGKRIDVRVSEAIAADRVDFYAYDERNADIDLLQLPSVKSPTIEELQAEALQPVEPDTAAEDAAPERRRRRRRSSGPADATAMVMAGGFDDLLDEFADEEIDEADVADDESADASVAADSQPQVRGDSTTASSDQPQGEQRGRRRRRGRRGRGGRGRGGDRDGQAPRASGDQAPIQQNGEYQPPPQPAGDHADAVHAPGEADPIASDDAPTWQRQTWSIDPPTDGASVDPFTGAPVPAHTDLTSGDAAAPPSSGESIDQQSRPGRRRRRRGGRGRGHGRQGDQQPRQPAQHTAAHDDQGNSNAPQQETRQSHDGQPQGQEGGSKRRRRRRRGGRGRGGNGNGNGGPGAPQAASAGGSVDHGFSRAPTPAAERPSAPSSSGEAAPPAGRKRRTLYRRFGKVSSLAKSGGDADAE